jgi:CBS domain-containing protein
MSRSKRLSQSLAGSWREPSPHLATTFVDVSDDDVQEWLTTWRTVFARDLIDSRIVSVDADTSVEEACDVLLSEGLSCLAVKANVVDPSTPFHGLFDYADVNAFLTLAATSHTFFTDDLRSNPKANDIVTAAKAGRVPVHLVSNLSEKNIIEILPHDATLVSLLEVFARGSHRTLIRSSSDDPQEFIGMVTDHRLLRWFALYARETQSFQRYLSNQIQSLSLPSLNLNNAVISATSSKTILDAMKLMSEKGVSSIAVVESSGTLLSAVSVTDICKIVVPSQSNQILTTPLHHFIAQIKDSDGISDGADKYPG